MNVFINEPALFSHYFETFRLSRLFNVCMYLSSAILTYILIEPFVVHTVYSLHNQPPYILNYNNNILIERFENSISAIHC